MIGGLFTIVDVKNWKMLQVDSLHTSRGYVFHHRCRRASALRTYGSDLCEQVLRELVQDISARCVSFLKNKNISDFYRRYFFKFNMQQPHSLQLHPHPFSQSQQRRQSESLQEQTCSSSSMIMAQEVHFSSIFLGLR